ncbi:MAG: asparaginase domain-containing protein [Bacillota bacterium]|nr:asparaginase domain-containing protein [Bacillota bacterium]
MDKILVIETGGTFATKSVDGVRSLAIGDADIYSKAEVQGRKAQYGFDFDIIRPIYTLSENMTIKKLNVLIESIRTMNLDVYKGVIITHGTDTMAYSANVLSMLFATKGLPLVLVSSNHPIDMDISNGTINFVSAIDFIYTSKVQGVFVVYKDERGEIQVHLGSRVKQMDQSLDGYKRYKNQEFGQIKDGKFVLSDKIHSVEELNKKKPLYDDLFLARKNILMLIPYVGLRYDLICLDNIDGIILGVYHSGTLNTDVNDQGACVNTIFKKALEKNIPVFISEVESDFDKYESSTALEKLENVHYIYDTSMENLHAKVLLGMSKYEGQDLLDYLNTNVFFEKLEK